MFLQDQLRPGHTFQNNFMKNFLYIAILTTAVIAAWVGLGLYHSSVDSTISQDNAIQIIPITPTFDAQTIENLKSRQVIKADLSTQKVIPTPTGTITPPAPSASVTPSSTPSIGNTNVSTSSGQIPKPI